MATRLWSVVIDCADPAALARWWAETLGWELTDESADEVELEAPGEDRSFSLVFGPVPEPSASRSSGLRRGSATRP